MSGYIRYFKTVLISGLQYRTAAFAGITTQFFWGIMSILIYQAFYGSTNSNVGINFSELVTYIWLNQAFLALIYIRVRDKEALEAIKKGTIAYELCRPYNLYYWWYIKNLSQKYALVILRFPLVILVGLLLWQPYNLQLPYSIMNFGLFFISLILGSLVITAIIMVVNVISFLTYDDRGISSIIFTIGELLSGIAIPVPLLPTVIKNITYYLPFRLIGDLPFRIYSNNIPVNEAVISIFLQIFWIIILIIIGNMMMKKVMKKAFIQGG